MKTILMLTLGNAKLQIMSNNYVARTACRCAGGAIRVALGVGDAKFGFSKTACFPRRYYSAPTIETLITATNKCTEEFNDAKTAWKWLAEFVMKNHTGDPESWFPTR